MNINLIVAVGRDGAIGKDGNLIWRLPADLKRFKSLTTGNTVIMGRKTWESLPKKPLPNRRNIILTRNEGFKVDGAEVVHSVGEALTVTENQTVFIIGGAEVYNAFMPYTDFLHLTQIDAICPEADAFLKLDINDHWEMIEISPEEISPEGVSYRYITYKRS